MSLFNPPNTAAEVSAMAMHLEAIRSELQAGLAQFQGTGRLDGARYLPAGGREVAWAGAGRLVGWSLRTVNGPVSLTIRNGRDKHGDVIAVVDLGIDESDTRWLGPSGVSAPDGVYLERSGAGTLDGAVWIGAVD